MKLLKYNCGNEIPFEKGQVMIHNPTLSEIGYISEESFWLGCETLRFDKNKLTSKDKNELKDYTNFDIIMSIMKDKNVGSQMQRAHTLKLLTVLFPEYNIQIRKDYIALIKEGEQEKAITNSNFPDFVKIISEMFCLKDNNEDDYNPIGDLSAKIADKFKERRKKLLELRGESEQEDVNILDRYMSILAIGVGISKIDLSKYTVFQLMDEYKRFLLKQSFDMYIKAKLSGAQDLEEVEEWTKDLYSKQELK